MSVAPWPRHACFFQSPLQCMFFLVSLDSCTITGCCALFHHQGLHWCVLFCEKHTQMSNTQMQCKCMCMHHTHTLNAHMIYACMYLWIVYSHCVVHTYIYTCMHAQMHNVYMHMHKHTTHSLGTCHIHTHSIDWLMWLLQWFDWFCWIGLIDLFGCLIH